MEALSAVVSLLADCTIKSLLIATIVSIALALLRCRDANIRHRTWTLVMAAMLALPVIAGLLPGIESPLWLPMSELQPAGDSPDLDHGDAPLRPGHEAVQSVPAVSVAREWSLLEPIRNPPPRYSGEGLGEGFSDRLSAPASPDVPMAMPIVTRSMPWREVFAFVYLGVAAFLLARLAVGIALTWRIVRRGRRLTSVNHTAFAGDLTIVESSEVRTPATVGIRRPIILLPPDWKTWSSESLELVVSHEMLHVQRRDALVNLLANINVALYWFHPLSWFLRMRLADLAERVCDDEVLRTHGDHVEYAETLLAMASRLADGGRVSPLAVPMARHADVETRIEAIIDDTRPLCRRLGWRGLAVLLAIAVPLVVCVAALQPARSAPAAEATSPTRQRGEEQTTKITNDTKEEASLGQPRASATGQRSEVNTEEVEEAKDAKSAGSVAGRVVSDGDGSAIGGAEVRLTGWNENRTRYDLKTAVTDDEGRFRFDDLPDGALQVIALYENLASRTERYHGLKVSSGDEALELRMKPVPALQVKVVDKATRQPLPGAKVRLTWTDGQRDHTTDDEGKVLIRGLTPELWTIEVFADGYAEREEAIQLNGTETTTITAALDPGFAVEGVVVDEAQKPLKDVGISVFPRDYSGGQIEYLRTDQEGKYRFGHLPLAGLEFSFSKDNFADQKVDVTPDVGAGKTQRLDVTLGARRDGGFVEGTVVDSESRAIVGAKVINVGRSSRDVRETFTDADGRFRLDDAFQGVQGYLLVVKSPGYAPGIARFSPGTHDEPTKLEVVLKPGHRVRGRVVDEQGEPLAGIYVGYDGAVGFGSDGDGGFIVTEADGRFKFDSLPAGVKFDIRPYSTAGKFSALREYKLPLDGDEEVVVTLLAEGVIRGRVVDAATGKPLPTFVARVTFSPDRTNDDPNGTLFGPRATGEGETFVSQQGEFRMSSFVQGMPLQVTIQAEGYERGVMRRVVARRESEAEPVEFRLKPIEQDELQTFAGQVVDQAGKGVGGVELRLIVAAERRAVPRDKFPFNWEMVRSGSLERIAEVKQFLTATTDLTGRFKFRDVAPGADIEIAYWGKGVSQGRFAGLEKLDKAKRQNLRIEIVPTGTVVGKIDRERFPDVTDVRLSGNGDSLYGKLNEKDATYRIENVAPGNYELQFCRLRVTESSAFLSTDVLHRERVEVKSGETTVVDVESTKGFNGEQGEATNPTRQRGEEGTTNDTKEEASRGQPRASATGQRTEVNAKAASEPAQPVSQAGDIVIRGKVTDEAGQPVADALLILPTSYGPDAWSAEATSTASGEFELLVPTAKAAPGPYTPGWTIWCYHPERRLVTTSAYRHLQRETNESITIVQPGPTDTGFEVTSPSGVPVSNALVEPVHFLAASGAYDIVPEKMQKLMSAQTDSLGRMQMPTIGREGFRSIKVTATGYGLQTLDLVSRGEAPPIRPIQLRAAGRIEGQLVCDDTALVAGVLLGFIQMDLDREMTEGQATVTTDDEGRFVVPEFAEGRTRVFIATKPGDLLLPRVPDEIDVFAGETTSIEIPYERAVRVAGRVQTDQGEGVPGGLVSVQYGGFQQRMQVRTDAEGRFAANVLPGVVRQQLIMRPKAFREWTTAVAGWQATVEVPDEVQEFELPPIELIPTMPRAGQLLDAEGQPLPGMRISAVTENRVYSNAKSEDEGRFVLHLPENLNVEEYTVHNDRGGRMVASVVTDSPFVIQVGR